MIGVYDETGNVIEISAPSRAGSTSKDFPLFRTSARAHSTILSLSGARRHVWATWIDSVDPSRRAVRHNLDGDSFRLRARLVADVMYVSAAYVSEALADTVGRGRAVVLIYRDRSFCYCDQTGTGMGVPPTLAPGLEGVLRDVEVGVAFHPRDEKPIRQVACTHQVEQAGWEVACRHGG